MKIAKIKYSKVTANDSGEKVHYSYKSEKMCILYHKTTKTSIKKQENAAPLYFLKFF